MPTDSPHTIVLDSGDRVVLMDAGPGPGTVNNITCFRPDGTVAWKPEMPADTGPCDAWVQIERRGGSLLAWTFSCYLCEIDMRSGKLLSAKFTK